MSYSLNCEEGPYMTAVRVQACYSYRDQLKLFPEATLLPAAHPSRLLTDEVIPHELLNKLNETYLMEMYPNKCLVCFWGVIKCTFPPPLVKQTKANLILSSAGVQIPCRKRCAGNSLFYLRTDPLLGWGDTSFCGKCLPAWLISGLIIITHA